MKALLVQVHRGGLPEDALPTDRRTLFRPGQAADDAVCRALGYRRIEPARRGRPRARQQEAAVAVRVDALERLAGALGKLRPAGPFTPMGELAAILDGDRGALELALPALGYHPYGRTGAAPAFRPRGRPKAHAPKPRDKPKRRNARADANSGSAPQEPAEQATEGGPVAAAGPDAGKDAAAQADPARRRRRRRKAKPAPESDGAAVTRPAQHDRDGQQDQQTQHAEAAAPAKAKAKRRGKPRKGRNPAAGGRAQAPAKGDPQAQSPGKAGPKGKGRPRPAEVDPHHPFAKLKEISFAK
jgi:hypothetical protein